MKILRRTALRRITAGILLIIVGLLAMYGGWVLMSDPSGDSFQFSLELLENTPFKDYFIPGVILFVFIGILGLLVAISAIAKAKQYARLLVLQGLLLLGWLTQELIFNAEFFVPILHYPLYVIGMLLVVIGYLESKKPLTK